MFQLKGRVAVVTGGESGIGLALSKTFAASGVKTLIGGILDEAGVQVAAELRAAGGEVEFIRTDVRVQGEVEALVQAAVDRYGRIDIMVNNAGVYDGFASIDETNEELWNQMININLKGSFFGCQAALKHMVAQRYGRIVNTSSIGGLIGGADGTSYTAAKFGVVGMTRQISKTHSQYGITINAVCPGAIDTNVRGNSANIVKSAAAFMQRGVGADPSWIQRVIPAQRKGTAQEVANLIYFLATEEASYISGQAIAIDGGWTA
ncbi:SDR family oxidoreductase [Pseudomonas sp. ZM23]|uniref:SDR family NAD(P)-dependent oxidoreductase n=1 Tax=Pseudomonas triclosanedens TaxID=2961893 RepID=A0ABY7A4B5_9PSED|nr:SDR family NAD(P)-dependent oxidoreductase [Pseudomonas triclosanedens]MCP8465056.1 SDR family oxidoreductase [Pseudomonas triclosanedens]MCP8470232.1 SDR family oxidoreductase [Pseudomonas triclosanedens]MCP8476037.1 SDR family oxidoreductase [Pseudomonas triclosanedens]WAI51725.1 SDR family NAD(P)-dependent oxidoreductase [Pseudomonas triclosanedens]